jgi:hypothetical protein
MVEGLVTKIVHTHTHTHTLTLTHTHTHTHTPYLGKLQEIARKNRTERATKKRAVAQTSMGGSGDNVTDSAGLSKGGDTPLLLNWSNPVCENRLTISYSYQTKMT